MAYRRLQTSISSRRQKTRRLINWEGFATTSYTHTNFSWALMLVLKDLKENLKEELERSIFGEHPILKELKGFKGILDG